MNVYFVDELSTCVPSDFCGHTRVVFYCPFPDKLLANEAFRVLEHWEFRAYNPDLGLIVRLLARGGERTIQNSLVKLRHLSANSVSRFFLHRQMFSNISESGDSNITWK